MTTTISTVTAQQIRRLRTEAIEAGDSIREELCGLALGVFGAEPTDEAERALAACVDVINDAEAA